MADWKQITARIRRARGSRDPAGQLTLLFEKTKDAMVAFELGRHFDVVRDPAQALQWYQTAASRFRRGEWKTKATEAIVRLGGEVPADSSNLPAPSPVTSEHPAHIPPLTIPEPAAPFAQNAAMFETLTTPADEDSSTVSSENSTSASEPTRRRRGRRGGRNRNKKPATPVAQTEHPRSNRASGGSREPVPPPSPVEPLDIPPPRSVDARSIPQFPVEASSFADSSAPGVKGRFGDPGLSSRLSLLEMQLRRLLTCTPAKIDHAEHAPVGPGVFVLTDDDMTTYYHVEACDTLRIAIGNVARSGSTRRGNANLRPLLADLLGISEARVTKYLAEHCVVRWLQLDEGAPQFAHFAIAVLRPTLNE